MPSAESPVLLPADPAHPVPHGDPVRGRAHHQHRVNPDLDPGPDAAVEPGDGLRPAGLGPLRRPHPAVQRGDGLRPGNGSGPCGAPRGLGLFAVRQPRGRHRHTEDPRANRLVPLTGGAPIKLESTTVVGRDPDNISDYPGAACVSLNDVTRSISKTHAALALAPGGLWITDLHSTNGTRIEEEGHVTVARPGESIPVPTGATIVLGSAAYRVED